MIDPIALRGTSCAIPPAGADFDVMLEAKAKDLALLRFREQLAERGFRWAEGRVSAAGS